MKSLYVIIYMLSVGISAVAQPQVYLRLTFNSDQNQYEVFAQPNFTSHTFRWGPSQISLVLPSGQAASGLYVRSVSAGTWSDYSVISATTPESNVIFHGITTGGGKMDMVNGQDQLLFTFTLPTGYVENVRLFNNETDPNSSNPIMHGGDFKCYMSDEKGIDYLATDNRPASLLIRKGVVTSPNEENIQVIAYPNPAPAGTFKLFLKGFSIDEKIMVCLYTITGVEYKRITGTLSTIAGQTFTLPTTDNPYWLLSVEKVDTGLKISQRIWTKN